MEFRLKNGLVVLLAITLLFEVKNIVRRGGADEIRITVCSVQTNK